MDTQPSLLTVDGFRDTAAAIEAEIGQFIVGQKEVVRATLVTIIAGGHTLLKGFPVWGKTMLIRTLGQVLNMQFSRIQSTP